MGTTDDRGSRIGRTRPLVRRLRAAVQSGVFLLVLWGGYDLWRFAGELEAGRVPAFAKPLSPEGFLPIGSLMSLKLWVTTGAWDPWHPAGMVILGAALALSLALRKSFCGWLCPVGTLSEVLWRGGRRLFGRTFALPRWADLTLRPLKYALLTFFFWIIVVRMSPEAIQGFLATDYWKAGDLKMLRFFTDMSATTAVVLAALVALSLVTKSFWCRFLCPYGALLGLLAAAGPVRVRRDADRCANCGACARHCPALLPVDRKAGIASPECIGCLTCVSRCPVPGALDVSLARRRVIPPWLYAAALVAIFFGILLAARATGHWHSGVSGEEYLRIVPSLAGLAHA
ncbi:MAG TPA: 4Fe-4S binding protein [bacterium]